jgi:16S rRNA (cytosine1402-N4)-methyltransferase
MRMNTASGATAADFVNTAGETELAQIFREFGEETNARRIAAEIVRVRINQPIRTTLDLASVVERVVPRRGKMHPATARLAGGGRLAVITFHSLEDRIVKNFFKQRCAEWIDDPTWPAPRKNPLFLFRPLTRKPVEADKSEQAGNPRSRSAKLRAVEKI